MTASFSSSLSSKERLIIAISLLSLITWIFPAIGKAHAETATTQKSLVFEIKPLSEIQTETLTTENQQLQTQLQAELQKREFAKIDKKVALLKGYLQSKNSPFADYTEILLAQPDWKKIIAISNAESNMGLHCYVNNCSGIFGSKGLRTYETIPNWIIDMQNLITQRYSNKTLDQMNGVYVYPRSRNWYQASSKVYNDLTNLESQFTSET